MRVYIAGKITGLVYEDALRAFAGAESMLAAHGHEPVNPMRENGLDGDGVEHPWAEYMKRDIPHLLRCDAIYLLPTWKDSKGARLEKHIADELGMRVMTAVTERLSESTEISPTNEEPANCCDCGRQLSDADMRREITRHGRGTAEDVRLDYEIDPTRRQASRSKRASGAIFAALRRDGVIREVGKRRSKLYGNDLAVYELAENAPRGILG